MRIVIDLQGAQTESRFRGIGRYSLSFTKGIVRNRGAHEVFIVLNGRFPESIEAIRAEFDGLLPQENLRVWYAPGPISENCSYNSTRRSIAELVREAFIFTLKPDVIHICSLFEGFIDDAAVSIGRFDRTSKVSVTLHDLIPLANPECYLEVNRDYADHYQRKLSYSKEAAIYLAVSDFSKSEGVKYLGAPAGRFFNTSEAVESLFQRLDISDDAAAQLRRKFTITRQIILYSGGADKRKNLSHLIQAYAKLPLYLRDNHQLVFVGKIAAPEMDELKGIAKATHLRSDEICFTGYVTDNELVLFYNLCTLFVFPSWQEGFGLPGLEAMACGAPVIAANTSSLPEVIGLPEALFNPFDIDEIADKILAALTDEAFRARLSVHGLQQSRKFSWDHTASRALEAWASLFPAQEIEAQRNSIGVHKPRLAFVSPLPPERTGIADYSAQLLPRLADYYDIDVIVASAGGGGVRKDARWRLRNIDWFRAHSGEIDRVVYQVGNSPFHAHMLPLIQEIPGIVVLHDFYLGSLLAWNEIINAQPFAWTRALYLAHGYGAIRERFRDADAAKRMYPANFELLRHAIGLIAHSNYSKQLTDHWYGKLPTDKIDVIPLVRAPVRALDRASARQGLKLNSDDFLVCSFGFLDSTKLNHRLLSAWLDSSLASDPHCHLVFVGENCGGTYGENLLGAIEASQSGNRICISGFASAELFDQYLTAADLAVQLRTCSRGETSAAVLDCMNYALPVIVNANGSMAELNQDAVWMLPDEFEDIDLTTAIETLRRSPECRKLMGTCGQNAIRDEHHPASCAQRYHHAIELRYRLAATATAALIRVIAKQLVGNESQIPSDADLVTLAADLSSSLPLMQPAKRFFLDITGTCHSDRKTGIERVARALLLALIESPPVGFRIEPIYLCDHGGEWHYRYAHSFTLTLLGCSPEILGGDERVEPESGDVLLGLDLSGDSLVRAEQAGLFSNLRNRGVEVYFIVHDLLPVKSPTVFPPGADAAHVRWLQSISKFDGAIGISKNVIDDLRSWHRDVGFSIFNRRPFHTDWLHLGADLLNSAPSRGLPADAERIFNQLGRRLSFLMVGTIEPRKGYRQIIEAFDLLWGEGLDLNLVIVGREGWQDLADAARRDIPETIALLRNHPERDARLFWINEASDEYLEKIYGASTCLIAASYGEGFGLPLIEAAKHRVPIVARDIPVFREVAGKQAFYFIANQSADFAVSLKEWLTLYDNGQVPSSDGMATVTWAQCAENLCRILFAK